MNRRAFFTRVGAAAAVPALVKLSDAVEATTEASLPVRVTTPAIDLGRPPSDVTVRAWWDDRLAVLHRRQLLAPCPNCEGRTWKWKHTHLECGRCGWIARAANVEQPCRCIECTDAVFGGGVQATPAIDAPLTSIERDYAPGVYRVIAKGQPVEKRELNAYDVTNDDYVHNAIFNLYARVRCAVRVSTMSPRHAVPMGVERVYRRKDGDQIILAWHLVDCYEWQVERGERPEPLYHRDEYGRVTLVSGPRFRKDRESGARS